MINTKDTKKKKKNYNFFCYFGCDKLQLVYYHLHKSTNNTTFSSNNHNML